ncbi:MAG: TonB-dependent receptor [Bacteroidetes bacterium]|nr:TonB-dependent receptor [Bacteroidota bacterium]
MKKLYTLLSIVLFSASSLFAQVTISGKITNEKGEGLPFASIGIKDSYDGTSSDDKGNFSFSTTAKGEVIITASFLGFEGYEQKITIAATNISLNIKLKEKANELNTVVITAGSFEASDKKKSVILRPIDIVTTAGANGDIDGALKTLPGAQSVNESEGIFVRGGSAGETKTIIDEMVVANPYSSSVPDIPQRGRFSPFLFKGTIFSTGGYSAQYGQALSSTLVLNTEDLADQTSSSVFLSIIGGGVGHTERFKKSSLSLDFNYANLTAAFIINKQNRNWVKPPEAYSGSVIYRYKPTETSIFKVYSTFSQNGLSLNFPNISDANSGVKGSFWQRTYNGYLNTSYTGLIAGTWQLFAGASYSLNHDTIRLNVPLSSSSLFTRNIGQLEQLTQGKVMVTKYFGTNTNLRIGSEVWVPVFNDNIYGKFDSFPSTNTNHKLMEVYAAAFVESDIFITRKLALRLGERTEYSKLLDKYDFAPRISIAYKTGTYSQVSFAYGHFYQTPQRDILLRTQASLTKISSLNYEKATHYILNYQLLKDDRTFRIEAYYKQYDNFITFNRANYLVDTNTIISNSGNGYARGIDVFWRDKKTFKNVDYWVSYSYLDTKRKYRDYPMLLEPTFATPHTVSVVYKQFFTAINTSLSLTYTFATGRPYYYFQLPPTYPHETILGRTYSYNNLSLGASYLTKIKGNFTVIFASLNNILGFDNVYGYRYAFDGNSKSPLYPTTKRGFFIGMFVSIGRK